ncbi:MAG: hypothetical protein ACREDD_09695 [Methylocella sp.]
MSAGYVLPRPPLEAGELYAEWLRVHYPGARAPVAGVQGGRKPRSHGALLIAP